MDEKSPNGKIFCLFFKMLLKVIIFPSLSIKYHLKPSNNEAKFTLINTTHCQKFFWYTPKWQKCWILSKLFFPTMLSISSFHLFFHPLSMGSYLKMASTICMVGTSFTWDLACRTYFFRFELFLIPFAQWGRPQFPTLVGFVNQFRMFRRFEVRHLCE